MGRQARPWIGRLGLQLALAFVGVALAAVFASILLGAVTTSRSIDELVKSQHEDLAQATANSAAAAYHRGHWVPADLAVLFDFVKRAGAVVQVRASNGQVITARDFDTADPASQVNANVTAGGVRVGSVAVRFDNAGLGQTIRTFQAQRWPAWIGAAGVAAVIALLVALLLSRRITAPVESLIETARARGRGELGARAGDVRGL